MTFLKEYWDLLSRYLRSQKRFVAGLVIVLTASIVLQLLAPRVLRDFIDLALTGDDSRGLTQNALFYFGLVLLIQLSSILATYLSEQVAWTATNALRVDLVEHCLRLDMTFHQSNPPGTLIEKIDGDVDALSNFFSQFVVRITANFILVIGVLVLLYREDWRAGAGLNLFVVIAVLAMLRIRKVGVPLWAALRQKVAEAFGFLGEILHGTEDIRASGATKYILWRFDEILRSWLPIRRKAMLAFSLIWTTTLILFTLGTGTAFGIGYALWSIGAISAGTVYLIFNYTELTRRPIEEIRTQMEDLQRAGASISRVRDLLALQPKVRDGKGVIFPEGALDVKFHHVTFRYGDDETALNDIHFRLPSGKVLGLLGRTGSGKSTLARLLLRLYDPSSGHISLGNIPIQHAKLAEISKKVGFVQQEVRIFRSTVRDNLTLFDPAIGDEKILDVIHDFELSSWFQSLPSGLDTELSQEGGLSAGQAQLLNFARITLREPDLVILDEATSRLDLATEAQIDRATQRLLQNRTGIIIAHRLHTVQKTDLIMILENGCIAEYAEREKLVQDPASRFSSLLQTGLEEELK